MFFSVFGGVGNEHVCVINVVTKRSLVNTPSTTVSVEYTSAGTGVGVVVPGVMGGGARRGGVLTL